MTEATKPQTMKFYLKDARLAFTQQIFEAKQGTDANGQPSGKAKFSVTAIIETGTTKAFFGPANPDSPRGQQDGFKWGDVKEAFSAAAMHAAKRQSKWAGKEMDVLQELKAGNRLCLHDGDAKASQPGYKGNLYMAFSNEIRPAVVGRDGAPVTAASGIIYSGCYGDVVGEIWPQDNKFGKRVNASLMAVIFARDGERLAGGSVASADDYAAIPAAAAQAAQTSGSGAASLF